MDAGERTPGFGRWIGTATGIGAALGIVFGMLLEGDISGGLWLGAAFGFLAGLLIDAVADARHAAR